MSGLNGGVTILRVISGTARGHKLRTIKGMTTRPTADRVKESLYNMLAPYIDGSDVLDLFAGTGSLGIEALSRGARFAAFVDKSGECCRVIRENLEHTKLSDKGSVYNRDFAAAVEELASKAQVFDIILLDPPYNKNLIQETLKKLTKNDIIRDDGILVAEHHIEDVLPEVSGKLVLKDRRVYGDTVISIYVPRLD